MKYRETNIFWILDKKRHLVIKRLFIKSSFSPINKTFRKNVNVLCAFNHCAMKIQKFYNKISERLEMEQYLIQNNRKISK